jgi:hypothetical protein
MKSKFFVSLQGGIGNQLFQVCSGLYYAKKFQKDMYLVLASTDNHDIFSILSESKFKIYYRSKSKIIIFVSRLFNWMLKNLKMLSFISGIHYPKEVGFDVKLSLNGSFKELRGYYQTYIYLEEVKNELISKIEVEKFSDWYWQQKSIINSTSYPVMMHIRRGDYSQHSDSFGLLSIEYYEYAINHLRKLNFTGPVWIFSDDIEIAKSFAKLLDESTHIVNPPLGTNASESMALMWEFSAHIIANSTFSWWGAILSNNSKVVIAPDPWFINGLKIKNLIPPNWIKLDAIWEN